MQIAAFGVEHLAEETLLGHVEGVHLEEVVNAVLKHHAVELFLLGLVDKRPDFLEAGCGGHLYCGVLAVVHCVEGHGGVVHPVSDDVDKVNVGTLAELFPCIFRAAVAGNVVDAFFLEPFLHLVNAVLLKIAHGYHFGAGDGSEALHCVGSAHAEANEAYAHGVHGTGGESHQISRAFGTGRNLSLNHLRFLVGGFLGVAGRHYHKGESGQTQNYFFHR